jgi:hypothetical protein
MPLLRVTNHQASSSSPQRPLLVIRNSASMSFYAFDFTMDRKTCPMMATDNKASPRSLWNQTVRKKHGCARPNTTRWQWRLLVLSFILWVGSFCGCDHGTVLNFNQFQAPSKCREHNFEQQGIYPFPIAPVTNWAFSSLFCDPVWPCVMCLLILWANCNLVAFLLIVRKCTSHILEIVKDPCPIVIIISAPYFLWQYSLLCSYFADRIA